MKEFKVILEDIKPTISLSEVIKRNDIHLNNITVKKEYTNGNIKYKIIREFTYKVEPYYTYKLMSYPDHIVQTNIKSYDLYKFIKQLIKSDYTVYIEDYSND